MENITGIILAGGKSSRMGTDKGLLSLNGKKIVEHISEALAQNTNTILVIANNTSYDFLGYKVFQDIIKNCGPMGGIYTALEYSETENNMIASCDIPAVSSGMIEYIISQTADEDALIPIHNGETEPLCAVYKKTSANKIKEIINSGNYKMKDALKKLNTRYIDVTQYAGYTTNLFSNINTPQEFKALK